MFWIIAFALTLLGAFAFTQNDEPIILPGTTQRLLAFLAVNRTAVHRLFVAGCLWPETSERRASGNLRTTLWRLNAVSADVVVSRGDCLALNPVVEVDLYRVVALAHALMRGEQCPDDAGALPRGGGLDGGDECVVLDRPAADEAAGQRLT